MATKFTPAPEVQAIAGGLIAEHHGHLNGIRVVYVFRDDTPKVNGKDKWGEARKISNLAAFLAGFDEVTGEVGGEPFFVITMSLPVWEQLGAKEKSALVDHELAHLWAEVDGEGALKLSILPHDLEEFASIVQRHGLWREDVKLMASAMERHKYQLAMRMDDAA